MSKSSAALLKQERSPASAEPNDIKTEGDHAGMLEGYGMKLEPVAFMEEGGLKLEDDTAKEEQADVDMQDAHSSRSTSAETKSELEELKLEESPSSETPPVSSKTKVKAEKRGPQLIGHLPRAEEDAMRTFVEIGENHYQYGTLGRSRDALESMTCDCSYEHGVDDPTDACGDGSDCINRLTQVECMVEDCRCRGYCQNQRFQRKEYASIEIVQTEKKGFGLRAGKDLPKDTFIYEYVGDVVSQPSFLKRMRLYVEEGIRHFYFMMLQKDEYIDATKRGGIGRFANHSCNPNCYVAKWTVGSHVRMGIFASRNIQMHEELTFNYNVDRYGHDAQPCYCGEPKCVGFIGGKTQTDLAAMDDLYLDALGITEEVEMLGLKGNKKKKSKKLDEDFIPDLKPLVEKDVPKVVQAMRQTQSRKVLLKLLTRIKITEDLSALRQIMRLRGFSVMTNILKDSSEDFEVVTAAIECMMTWPLIQRNKVEDSQVIDSVRECTKSPNEVLAGLAQKLLDQWEKLEYAYRIPKRQKTPEDDEPIIVAPSVVPEDYLWQSTKRMRRSHSPDSRPRLAIKPRGFSAFRPLDLLRRTPTPPPVDRNWRPSKADIAAIIAQASAAVAEAASAPPAPQDSEGKPETNGSSSNGVKKKSSRHHKQSKEEKEANKEKRLLKLVGAVVVKCMSKYQKQMDHDVFKKHAKELTHVVTEKEKKSSSYRDNKLDKLSDEKVTKIKKFAKEYIAKVLRKLEKAGQRRKPPSKDRDSTASGSAPVHNDAEEGVGDGADHLDILDMTAEDGMDPPDDDDDEGEGEQMGEGSGHDHSSPLEEEPEHASQAPSPIDLPAKAPSDPRVRHRNEENGWDPNSRPPMQSALFVGR